MTCISCKRELPDDAVFCLYCGKKQIKQAVTYHRRGNGLGTAYKDRSNHWVAEVTLGYYFEDGKRKRRSARKYGFPTKRDALLYIDKLRSEQSSDKKITISELWERLTPEVETLSSSKQTAYRIAWNSIKPYLAHRMIDEVTSAELQEITDKAKKTYYTRKDIKTLLSRLYQLAMRDDFVDKNRAQFIRLPSLEKHERDVFTDKEINKLWAAFQSEPDHVTAAALLMMYTGMRTGEAKAIKRNNIHLSEHYMTGGAKTEKGKNRKIIIPDKLVPVLNWLLSFDGEELFPFGRNYLHEQWEKKKEVLNVNRALTLYCCRHTYITRLTALNVSPAMLQELAGHEDYETTLNYTHLSIDDRLKAVNQL